MKLHQLFTNFSLVPDDTQRHMVRQYRAKRAEDFTKAASEYDLKKATSKRQPALVLTDEEKALIKKLGISRAQLLALKASQEPS